MFGAAPRHPIDSCVEVPLVGGGSVASCTHTDDWLNWTQRRDVGPCLTFLNIFLGYMLSTVDAGAYRLFASLLTSANMIAISFVFSSLSELSIVVSNAAHTPATALRAEWAGMEPVVGALVPTLLAVVLGIVFERALRAPPIFAIDPCRSYWQNAKYFFQSGIVFVAALYFGEPTETPEQVNKRLARPEWISYAMSKTLALLIVYFWNRSDAKNRMRIYGMSVWSYDAAQLPIVGLYVAMLLVPLYAWASALALVFVQFGLGLALSLLVWIWRRRVVRRTIYGELVQLRPNADADIGTDAVCAGKRAVSSRERRRLK